jgi:hypothetical protein
MLMVFVATLRLLRLLCRCRGWRRWWLWRNVNFDERVGVGAVDTLQQWATWIEHAFSFCLTVYMHRQIVAGTTLGFILVVVVVVAVVVVVGASTPTDAAATAASATSNAPNIVRLWVFLIFF